MLSFRLPGKWILIGALLLAGLASLGIDYVVLTTQSLLGIEFSKTGSCFCSLSIIAVFFISGMIIYFLYSRSKKKNMLEQMGSTRHCRQCGAKMIFYPQNGWFCENCLKYE